MSLDVENFRKVGGLTLVCTRLRSLERLEEPAPALSGELALEKLVDLLILLLVGERVVSLVDSELHLSCLKVDVIASRFIDLLVAFFLYLEHLFSVITLLWIYPGIVGQLVPVLLLIDNPEPFGRIAVKFK